MDEQRITHIVRRMMVRLLHELAERADEEDEPRVAHILRQQADQIEGHEPA